ncbi:nuclease-related domain-containing DEAD/DEAH box helicase [Methanolobus sp.]|jgi:hypothetical protein|uniref:nuclease-related domain-containing DEAD/DEAH box helicase n=1 Tax=Methanolobus sp. TaxID=1874737 RepID=UPI0025CF42E1|nr:NERD domain-containing protein [Methanolobus sp.]
MANLYPSLENINRLKVPPTEGELFLLTFLKDNLEDDFEVYFQPYLNGDRPDIVLMKEKSGAMIIEVKDWNLKNSIYKNSHFIKNKSPLDQVYFYKKNLFNLHIKGLLELKIENPKLDLLISCAVYFHKAKKEDIVEFEKQKRATAARKNIELIVADSLTTTNFKEILFEKGLYRESNDFTNELYKSFKRYLQPSLHTIEDGIPIIFTKRQKNLTVSQPGEQKIKGVVGSGKTLVMARRAVSAHKRTKNHVLLLTYNITLINYIHDKISDVREEYDWKYFHIVNYHQFFKAEANNHGLKRKSFENELFYEDVKDEIVKYDAIFIDEVQDYKIEWLRIIKKYFLADGGEFVLFGDEKQNIYERDMESDRKPKTNVIGRWKELNESFRLTTRIADIAIKYQKYFFSEKYDFDNIKVIKQKTIADFGHEKPYFEYYFLADGPDSLSQVHKKVYAISTKLNIQPNDICILSSKKQTLIDLDFVIRSDTNEKTEMMCVTKEVSESVNNDKLERIEKSKKLHFWMNSGTMKLSTIHSFKGLEISTLFLIIEKNPAIDNHEELIYTGITRCIRNLVVINIGHPKYDSFFKKIERT